MLDFNNKFIERFFRPVDNVVWDLMSGRVGHKGSDGIITIELGELSADKSEAEDPQVVVNPFDQFGMEIPAFAQSVAVEAINLGDMIFSNSNNRVLGWVVKKNDKSFKLMKQDGTRSDWRPPKVQMLGFDSGVMVLRSLLNMLPGGNSGLAGMQSMLMPMMAMGMMGDTEDSVFDLKSMLPMMLMSQMGLGMDGNQSSGAGGMGNMLPMMMMMKMLGGKDKSNSSSNKGRVNGKNFFND